MNARDQAIANEVGTPAGLSCTAAGCPNRWSVDAGKGRLCSAHAWSPPRDWPTITRQQQDAETDRARAFSMSLEPRPPLTEQQKLEILTKLRTTTIGRVHRLPGDGA